MTEKFPAIICRHQEEPLSGDLWKYKGWHGPEKAYLINGYRLVEDQGEECYALHDLEDLHRVLDRLSVDRTIDVHHQGKWSGWKTIMKGLEND